MNQKAHVACNLNCLFENRLLKVTANHEHCECGNVSETLPDSHCCCKPLVGTYIICLIKYRNSDDIESRSMSYCIASQKN